MYYVAVCYFCFDNIFCILVVHLAGQFRILRYRFTKLCNLEHETSEVTLTKHAYEFYAKLKMYIRHHQLLINYCKRLETVYTMIIFGQVLVFSVLICLFAYQGLLVGIYTLSWISINEILFPLLKFRNILMNNFLSGCCSYSETYHLHISFNRLDGSIVYVHLWLRRRDRAQRRSCLRSIFSFVDDHANE